jgi:tetratricopeptide (TPR) repeat protein
MRLALHWLVALLLLAPCALALAQAAEDTLERARALLDQGAAQQAYELLAPQQAEHAGEAAYDYLLGLSALEVGRNTEAVLAFERVLAVDPNNALARAQLGRAYLQLQEVEGARREFTAVQAQDLSPQVRDTIGRYLTAIEQPGGAERATAAFFLELTVGYDSNVNGGPDTNQFAVPATPGTIVRLAPGSTETPDGFFSISGGMAARAPLGGGRALVAGFSAYRRMNFTEADFDNAYLDGYVGLSAMHQHDTFSVIGQGNIFVVEDPAFSRAYRNALGGMLQWTRDIDARNQFTAYAQYASLSYPEQSLRDAQRYVAGLGYAHALTSRDASVYAGLYAGAEQTDDAFEYLAYSIVGVLAGGQLALTPRSALFATAAYERREYRDVDPFFSQERRDAQYSVTAGVSYLVRDKWRISPQLSWLTNDSNVDIAQYDRWQAFVSLRRDW